MLPERTGTIGPYRILKLLGQGGMGVVYEVESAGSGQRFALKTVSVPDEVLLQGLRREIRALARLRHPGIVQIVDEGIERGLPWYAMELVEGVPLGLYWRMLLAEATSQAHAREPERQTDLLSGSQSRTVQSPPALESTTRSHVVEAPEVREAFLALPPEAANSSSGLLPVAAGGRLDLALELIARICGPLGYLHGEGLVHRDLKAGNILVLPDGRPVLIDFGLLSQFRSRLSREELEIAGGVSGTVHSMSPEQIRGELVDARSDLYALGCLLFEMVTGRKLFPARTTQDVLNRHLSAPIPRAAWFVEGVPEALEELLLRLLSKERSQRLGYASDVLRSLSRLGVQEQIWPGAPFSRTYLYRPSFEGRQVEVDRIHSALGDLGQHRGSLLLLKGESGIGKTRLAVEAARSAHLRGLQLLTGNALDPGPLGAFRQPLQHLADRCRQRGSVETEKLLGRRGRLLGEYEPALLGLPGVEADPEPVALPLEAAWLRLFSGLAQTLAAYSSEIPTLVVLDDLQAADELTLGFLKFLATADLLKDQSWMILGVFRSDEPRPELQSLLRFSGVLGLSLGSLREEEVAAMTGSMLALSPAPVLFSRVLFRISGGNPFFVAESLQAAVEEGLLWRDEDGRWQVAQPEERTATEADYDSLGLPGSLMELIERRLSGLSMGAREALEAASLLGIEIDPELLEGLVPHRGAEIEDLLRQHLLWQGPNGRLRFAQGPIRQRTYEGIESERRQRWHRWVAGQLAEKPELQRDWGVLADHWERAGEPDAARTCALAGASRALQRFAHDEAERLYRVVLRLTDSEAAEAISLHNELARRVLIARGRFEAAETELRLALDLARRLKKVSGEGAALQGLGHVEHFTGRLREGQAHYEQAREVFERISDFGGQAEALSGLGAVLHDQGRLEAALELYQRSIEMFRSCGDEKSEGRIVGNLAILRGEQGDLAEARQLYEKAVSMHRKTGEKRLEGIVLGNLALLHATQGRNIEAQLVYGQALAIHREVGNRRSEGVVLGNLAQLESDAGHFQEALQLYGQARSLHQQVGNRQFEAKVLRSLAALSRRQGDLDEAERWLAHAETLVETLGETLYRPLYLCERGHIELARGRSARAILDKVQELSVEAGTASDLERARTRLEKALEAFESGQLSRLAWGELKEDLPPGANG